MPKKKASMIGRGEYVSTDSVSGRVIGTGLDDGAKPKVGYHGRFSKVTDPLHDQATCMNGDPHLGHVWYYTSEGGGHMLNAKIAVDDPDARRWECPGVPDYAVVALLVRPLGDVTGMPVVLTFHPDEMVDVGWTVSVGLPVWFEGDENGQIIASVDWSEAMSGAAETVEDEHVLKAIEQWVALHDVYPVAFPKVADPSRVERCPQCGAPISKWYDPELDGDVTPRSDCLTIGCLASTT